MIDLPLGAVFQFLSIVAVGCYVQTVTGFALGLTVMGGVALLGVVPLNVATAAVTLVSLVNTSFALKNNAGNIAFRYLIIVVGMSLPFTWLGVWLLHYWQGAGQLMLARRLLGGVIAICAILFMLRPSAKPTPSSNSSFFVAGALAGFLGGMYATSGPPIVFHFYRQPWLREVIRDTLLAAFFLIATFRVIIAYTQDAVPIEAVGMAVYAVPVVLLFTWFAKRMPPKVSDATLRRFVFAVLIFTGVALLV